MIRSAASNGNGKRELQRLKKGQWRERAHVRLYVDSRMIIIIIIRVSLGGHLTNGKG